MSIKALFTTKAFLPDPKNIGVPLGERFPSDNVGFLSVGIGGWTAAAVRFRKGAIQSVSAQAVEVANPQSLADATAALQKLLGGVGAKTTILGISKGLDVKIASSIEAPNQDVFVATLQSDPVRYISQPQQENKYIGLLRDSTGTALVAGINRAEMQTCDDYLKSKNIQVVRRCIPALTMFNLLLADHRVTDEGYIPVVADHGAITSLTLNEGAWDTPITELLAGGSQQADRLEAFTQRLSAVTADRKILLAASVNNGGFQIEQGLKQAGFECTPFTIGSIKQNELFAYATALY